MDMISIVLSCFLVWVLLQVLLRITRNSNSSGNGNLPPGPTPFPVIGNLLELGDKPHQSLAKLAKRYGPIMTIKLGQMTTVVISSPAMAKQVLQKQDLAFSNRAQPDSARTRNHHQFSLVWLPVSAKWRSLRKICNSHIFSSQKLDSNYHLRRLKVEQLVAEVRESCKTNASVDIGQVAFRTSLNLLSNTIFSMDMASPDSNIVTQEMKKMVWGIMEEVGKPNLGDYFPVLQKIDPQGIRRRLTTYFDKVMELLDGIIHERLELKKVHGLVSSNDVLDTLLSISEDQSEDQIDQTTIEHLLLDLFVAGTDTTSSTVEWAMTEILHNPETFSKARAELEQTIGKCQQLEESDITRLPYLQAIVKETFRLHPPSPLLVPRKVETDVEICGFTIPKGTQVLVNTWSIGRDPSVWEDPKLFKPERFLGSEIDVRGRDMELLPFGGGRRICPGMPLALRMVHLMLGSLINLFDWKFDEPENLKMEEKFGLTLQKARPLRVFPVCK
ncbi:geraniol 8-hydroxylase-like isoform X1 [Actinidia eriantha]|uniref:geraniol 8-hydroxylase-like isoform X1 n=2 Tax=Actinidia eriantha TaxID=165200 RepID=UPI00258B9C99|nr:geraniol 8-hydroxylase-like isoform X1 [Actinidia eriantha]